MAVPSSLSMPATPTVTEPEGLADGIYFVITHWFQPIASSVIEAAVTALIVSAGTAVEKEFKFTGGSVVAVFNLMLQFLQGTADAFSVDNASGIATTTTQLANLQQ